MNLAMQLNLSKSISHANQSFASAWWAFGLPGSSEANGRYRTNIVHLNPAQERNDHFWRTLLLSPIFSDLKGS
jgi:hypothetical protein